MKERGERTAWAAGREGILRERALFHKGRLIKNFESIVDSIHPTRSPPLPPDPSPLVPGSGAHGGGLGRQAQINTEAGA